MLYFCNRIKNKGNELTLKGSVRIYRFRAL